MKTEFKPVKIEDVTKGLGPELMAFLLEGLHTAVHEDAMPVAKRPLDKSEKPPTSK